MRKAVTVFLAGAIFLTAAMATAQGQDKPKPSKLEQSSKPGPIAGGKSTDAAPAQSKSSSVVATRDVYQIIHPRQVKMNGLLAGRMEANREGRLKKYMTEEWLLQGFRKRPGSHPWIGEHAGKWLHASTLALRNKPDDRELGEKVARIAKGLIDCQMKDGYLGTYSKNKRWTSWDVWSHKYDLIGLLSYYQTTSDKKTLDVCKRIGDLLISVFGENKRDILRSGTHAGMAATSVLEPMSLLHQLTGEKKYLEFCKYVIQRADAGPKIMTNIENMRSVQAVGNKKAYEMMSNYVGLVEHWRATGYSYKRGVEAARLAWESIVKENLFITGAPDAHEHFSRPGTLIPSGKCTETCVQVTWIQMNWQLLRATGDPRYARVLHHHYYNHMLAAQHPDGINWCYFTTMAGKKAYSGGRHCCGSSGPRAIALIPRIAYMTAKDKLAVNFYETSTFEGKINGVGVTVRQNTNYPWDGDISVAVEAKRPVKFALQLLVPSFVQSGQILIAGSKLTDLKAGTYAAITREWSGKTVVKIQFDMPAVLHTRMYQGKKRYAISRGPIVLALEKIKQENIQPHEVVPDLSLKQAFSKGWAKSGTQHTVLIKGKKMSSEGEVPSGAVDLVYKPYCEAGVNGEVINIWLPAATHAHGRRPVKIDMSKPIAKFAPGWKVANCGSDMNPGLRDKWGGRKNVLVTHPFSTDVPCVLRRKVSVPAGKKTRLRLVVAHHPGGDWRLAVKVGGKELLSRTIGKKTTEKGWATVTADLSSYAGKSVEVALENRANGWSWEAAYWAEIAVESE